LILRNLVEKIQEDSFAPQRSQSDNKNLLDRHNLSPSRDLLDEHLLFLRDRHTHPGISGMSTEQDHRHILPGDRLGKRSHSMTAVGE
jgi:hypothetical protein